MPNEIKDQGTQSQVKPHASTNDAWQASFTSGADTVNTGFLSTPQDPGVVPATAEHVVTNTGAASGVPLDSFTSDGTPEEPTSSVGSSHGSTGADPRAEVDESSTQVASNTATVAIDNPFLNFVAELWANLSAFLQDIPVILQQAPQILTNVFLVFAAIMHHLFPQTSQGIEGQDPYSDSEGNTPARNRDNDDTDDADDVAIAHPAQAANTEAEDMVADIASWFWGTNAQENAIDEAAATAASLDSSQVTDDEDNQLPPTDQGSTAAPSAAQSPTTTDNNQDHEGESTGGVGSRIVSDFTAADSEQNDANDAAVATAASSDSSQPAAGRADDRRPTSVDEEDEAAAATATSSDSSQPASTSDHVEIFADIVSWFEVPDENATVVRLTGVDDNHLHSFFDGRSAM